MYSVYLIVLLSIVFKYSDTEKREQKRKNFHVERGYSQVSAAQLSTAQLSSACCTPKNCGFYYTRGIYCNHF